MNRRLFILFIAALASGLSGAYVDFVYAEPPVSALLPADMKWQETPIPGVQVSVLVGDPAQPGLYIVRAKYTQGARLMPHTHPDTRYGTVLSGELNFGFGDTFDPAKAKRYPPGSQITVPANTPHFGWVDNGEAVLQEVGIGPSGITLYKK